MYAAKRFSCGPGAQRRDPTKQFYSKMLFYDPVVLARQSGRSFRNILYELYWAEHEVRLFLKNRSRAISLVEWDAKWLAATPHKVIFRRLAAAQPAETR